MDVYDAYLQRDLQEAVYMTSLKDLVLRGHKVCRLHKSLYSLKQASRLQNSLFSKAFIKVDFLRSKHDL